MLVLLHIYFKLLFLFTIQEEELQKHIKAENAGWCNTETGEKQPDTIALQPHSEVPEVLIKPDIKPAVPFESSSMAIESNGKF